MEIHSNTQCIPFRKGGRDYSKKILDVFSPVAPGQLTPGGECWVLGAPPAAQEQSIHLVTIIGTWCETERRAVWVEYEGRSVRGKVAEDCAEDRFYLPDEHALSTLLTEI